MFVGQSGTGKRLAAEVIAPQLGLKDLQVDHSAVRYANLEAGYLRQLIEHYDELAILTTNRTERIDGAFLV